MKHITLFQIALFILIIPCYSQNLVAEYPFSGNANDVSGNGHHGTVNGATLTADRFGSQNSAYYFNGNNNNIVFDNVIAQFGTSNFSVSFWMNTASSNHFKFMGNRSICTNTNMWEVSVSSGTYIGKIRGVVNQTNGTNLNSNYGNISVNDGNWHHIVFLRDGKTTKIYVDCVLDHSQTVNGIADVTSSTPFKIGTSACANVDDSKHYLGKLDDLKLYDYAISEELIFELCDNEPQATQKLELERSLNIFPNPSNGELTIENAANIDLNNVQIFDMLGRTVDAQKSKSQQTIHIDLSLFPKGMYLIKIGEFVKQVSIY